MTSDDVHDVHRRQVADVDRLPCHIPAGIKGAENGLKKSPTLDLALPHSYTTNFIIQNNV